MRADRSGGRHRESEKGGRFFIARQKVAPEECERLGEDYEDSEDYEDAEQAIRRPKPGRAARSAPSSSTRLPKGDARREYARRGARESCPEPTRPRRERMDRPPGRKGKRGLRNASVELDRVDAAATSEIKKGARDQLWLGVGIVVLVGLVYFHFFIQAKGKHTEAQFGPSPPEESTTPAPATASPTERPLEWWEIPMTGEGAAGAISQAASTALSSPPASAMATYGGGGEGIVGDVEAAGDYIGAWGSLPESQRPPPPAPIEQKKGDTLTGAQCRAMLHDKTHIFRRMWAAEAWAKMSPDRPACWSVNRVIPASGKRETQDSATFFAETLAGTHCGSTNWYEGNPGALGREGTPPRFRHAEAGALFGFDETIDDFCAGALGGWDRARDYGHAQRCVEANLNILSLYGHRLPYNVCRNLEWQGNSLRFEPRPFALSI